MYTVLAIDDDKATLDILEAQLTNLGYRIFTESEPEKGLETVSTLNPNLIFMFIHT